jgi:hypothetical protein
MFYPNNLKQFPNAHRVLPRLVPRFLNLVCTAVLLTSASGSISRSYDTPILGFFYSPFGVKPAIRCQESGRGYIPQDATGTEKMNKSAYNFAYGGGPSRTGAFERIEITCKCELVPDAHCVLSRFHTHLRISRTLHSCVSHFAASESPGSKQVWIQLPPSSAIG